MNRSSSSHCHFKNNGILSVNVLGAHHQQISQAFASRIPMDERFTHGEWTTLLTGSPVLSDALVSFDCRIRQMNDVGTHTIFYCEVEAIKMNENKENCHGLIYFNRCYHHIGQQEYKL